MKQRNAKNLPTEKYQFLSGGGEMGNLMRCKDWSASLVGTPDTWPQSLRTTLSIILNSKFPMFLFWGPHLICFYNDAYRPSLGNDGKHPNILGSRGEDYWQEIWPVIKPIIDQVLAGGEANWSEDQLIPIYRNGKLDDVYWTFSYSPVNDESGKPAGVFVTCNETTDKVTTRHKLEESKDQLEFAIEAAELGTWDYNPFTNKFTANSRLREWFGLPAGQEIDLHHAVDAIAEKDRQRIVNAIEKTFDFHASGGQYEEEYSIINPVTKKETIVHGKGKAWFNEEKIAYRFTGVLEDVTNEVIAQRKLEESETNLRLMIEKAPVAICVFRGKDHVVEIANEKMLELWSRPAADVMNKPIFEGLPEATGQGLEQIVNHVFTTGESFQTNERPVNLPRNGKIELTYNNFICEVLRNADGPVSGIMAIATEVTNQVMARKKIEEKEEQLRIALEGGELGTFDYYPETDALIWSDKTKEFFGLPADAEVNYGVYINAIHPEDRNASKSIAEQQAKLMEGGFYELEYRTIGVHDGRIRWIRSKGKVNYNAEGKAIRYTGVTQDITQLKLAEEKLRQFKFMADNASDPFILTDEEGKFPYLNKKALEKWGYTEEEAKHIDGRDVDTVVDNPASYKEIFKKALHENLPPFETIHRHKSGATYPVEINMTTIMLDGKPHLFAVARDITERKKAEQALRESEEKFRTMAESSDILIGVNDETVNAVYFNKVWEKLTGRSVEELMNLGWADLLHPDDRQPFLDKFFHAFKNKESYSGEFRILNKEGNYSWLYAQVQVRLHPDGSYAGHISSCIDITERKQSEEDIKRFKFMADNASEPFILMKEDGTFEYLNKAALEKWGYTAAEAKCLRVPDVDPVYNDEAFANIFAKAQKEDIPIFETLHKKKDGTIYPVEVNMGAFQIGDKPYLFAVARDISERKKAEQLLKQSEQRLLSLIESTPFPIGVYVGREMRIQFVNESILKAWDKTFDVVGKLYADVLPELTGQGIFEQLDEVFTTGIPFHAINQRVDLIVDGKLQPYYYNYSFTPLYNEIGEIYGVLNTAANVTDLNLANKKAEESEQRSRMAIEAANLGSFDWNLLTNEFTSSQRLNEIFGFPDQAYITHQDLINAFHPEDKPRRDEAVRNAPETGLLRYEARVIWPNKTIHWVRVYGKIIYDTELPLKMYGTVEDITVEKTIVQELEDSRTRLRIAIEASELGTWELNLVTKEGKYSGRYLEILGYNERIDLTYEQILKHLHPEDRYIRDKAFKDAMITGILHYESRIIWNDKTIHWIEDMGKVFYDEKNEPAKMIGTVRDITEEKNYKQQLKEREEKFRLLADSMPQHIWTADTAGNLNYYNKSVYDYSGLTPEQINTDGWIQIVHPEDREKNISEWFNSVSTGKDFLFEHRFRRYDGEYRWQLSRAIPQRDPAGNIQMWVGTSTDIQEIKEQEQQKDFFISMASHELKTPITSIKGYVQMMQSAYAGSEDTLLKKSLKVIDKQIITLISLISDLLDVSKIKSGSLVLNKQDFEISEMITEVANHIQHVNSEYDIIVSANAAHVFADRERISQVLINLLTNAVKYSPNSKEIHIKNFIEDDHVVVSVHDNGIGISKSDQERIFERFYRVEGKDEKTYPGFGIGLFICAQIIERHQGKIGVESAPGKGSVFHFSIPLKN